MTARSIALVSVATKNPVDAIRMHGLLLRDALANRPDCCTDLLLLERDGHWRREQCRSDGERTPGIAPLVANADAVVVQYNPFMYGRWGFAPRLLLSMAQVRLSGHRRPKIFLLLHEAFIPITGWRTGLMGTWQRCQLALLWRCSDAVAVSAELWPKRVGRWAGQAPTFHLPVGSTLPDQRGRRASMRATLGLSQDDILIGTFSRLSPYERACWVRSAEALARSGARARAVVLGANAAGYPEVPGIEMVRPGVCRAETAAAYVAAADVWLACYDEGVTTRRTSLMVALQHAVAVVGNEGRLTDPLWREAQPRPLLLARGGPVDCGRLVASLARNPRLRTAVGNAGRQLYEKAFDWHVLASRLVSAVNSLP